MVNTPAKRRLGCPTEANWKPEHTKILIMVQKSWEDRKIAESMGVSAATICRVRNTDIFRRKLISFDQTVLQESARSVAQEESIDKARKVICKAAHQAALKMRSLSKRGGNAERIQFEACKDILDRAGLKPKEVIETSEKNYSPEEMFMALEAARELEDVMKRLSNIGNPFVLEKTERLPEGSLTDKGPPPNPYLVEGKGLEEPPTDPPPEQAADNETTGQSST